MKINSFKGITIDSSYMYILVIISLFLNGCSSNIWSDREEKQFVDGAATRKGTADSGVIPNSGYQQHLHEWQTLKPSIERLVAVESELMVMMKQLSDIIDKQSTSIETGSSNQPITANYNTVATPVQYERNLPVVTKKPQRGTQTSEEEVKNFSSKSYAIQLFSLQDKSGVRPNFDRLINKHPIILSRLPPRLEEFRVNNTMYYRMKVGNFANQNEAKKVCTNLQLLKTSCMVVKANGVKYE